MIIIYCMYIWRSRRYLLIAVLSIIIIRTLNIRKVGPCQVPVVRAAGSGPPWKGPRCLRVLLKASGRCTYSIYSVSHNSGCCKTGKSNLLACERCGFGFWRTGDKCASNVLGCVVCSGGGGRGAMVMEVVHVPATHGETGLSSLLLALNRRSINACRCTASWCVCARRARDIGMARNVVTVLM